MRSVEPIAYSLGRDLHRLTGPETPAAMIFYKRVGETKFGIERLAAGYSFGVSDADHDSGSVVHPYFHVVILEDVVFRIVFPRFRHIVGARGDLSLGICQCIILHHTLLDAGGVTVPVAKGEFTFRTQNVILIASQKGNERKE